MFRRIFVILAVSVSFLAGTAGMAQTLSLDSQRGLVAQYCTQCHNPSLLAGGMDLEALDLALVAQNAELAEKVIRKVRVGMMPPVGQARSHISASRGSTCHR